MGDSANRQGCVLVNVIATERGVVTGTEERLDANNFDSQLPEGRLTQGLDSAQQGRVQRAAKASKVQ